MFPGTVIASVGDNPRHSVVIPSFRAIFLRPSNVELNDLLLDCALCSSESDLSHFWSGHTVFCVVVCEEDFSAAGRYAEVGGEGAEWLCGGGGELLDGC
jgi:hypothetical protein